MTCCGDPAVNPPPPFPPPPPLGANGCLKVSYSCLCIGGVNTWELDAPASCVVDPNCGQLSCTNLNTVIQLQGACVIGDPVPFTPVPWCLPVCCAPGVITTTTTSSTTSSTTSTTSSTTSTTSTTTSTTTTPCPDPSNICSACTPCLTTPQVSVITNAPAFPSVTFTPGGAGYTWGSLTPGTTSMALEVFCTDHGSGPVIAVTAAIGCAEGGVAIFGFDFPLGTLTCVGGQVTGAVTIPWGTGVPVGAPCNGVPVPPTITLNFGTM